MHQGEESASEASSAKPVAGDGVIACGGKAVPAGWPHLNSSQEVVKPFLACASPAEFVAMQRGVDMPRLVESLSDWDAVRLGATGPLDRKASERLGRKRATFIVAATEKFGVPLAEVFALFVLHSSFDDELRGVVQVLARDKHLGETLGRMAVVREELRRRGFSMEEFADRDEQAGDALRGLRRAGRDMLSSTPVSDGARYADLTAKREQLPPPYQEALAQVERALVEQHFSPGSVVAGAFDHLTFGVPLGFYGLMAGTGHGAYSLAQGKYEQATRELAPAALAVALYAGGKGARALAKATGGGQSGLRHLQVPALELDGLKALVQRMEERLGVNAARDLLRYLQASREGALVAAEWGEAGVLALYEARGNPGKAQAMLAEARRESARPASTREGGARSSSAPREYTGSRTGDFAAANRAAGLQATPKGMTWHHHQDRTTMQLVPTEVHARTGHTGGFSGGQ
ncbi:HNH endonuclease [Myxococcus sp. CA040A]|uniref:HNH endonuclease n=1 Tax=Myxococcus sp. CA040A TaxID=2741738 RepID=UPI00157A30B9|nr:HNH endonuclease [Myxococcus sp. CA040A]